MSAAPTNVWNVDLQPDEDWGPGVRGERLLERPPGTRLVSAVWELDAGAHSPKYHCHHAAEEMLVLLSGEAVLRTPGGERPLHEGGVAHFPVGAAGAHEVINRSKDTVRYLMIAAHSPLDVIEYIDESRIVVYSHAESIIQPGGLFFTHEAPADVEVGSDSPGLKTDRPMRRYHVTTFGCQMNAHDSERIKGMLESLGLGEAPSQEDADVLVFNTCTIREKPDTKLAAYLGDAGARKRQNPDLVVAVGGCYAEAQQERIFELYPQVDVAFGPGSIPHLGEWIGAGGEGPRGHFGTHEHFAGDLPMHRERAFSAWVQVSMGCNSKCSYCIVPAVRGREQSRRPGEIVAEVTRLAADGVKEVTLLGQNVNSWGRDLRPGLDTEFGELLRSCDAVDGIERIRFTSPHPKDFRDPVISAMAECDAVCEHIHLPLQSGSSRLLKAMRRTYDRERYLTLVAKLRDAIPGLALGTDIIVGFPGETEEDFRKTLEVVEDVRYNSAYTFIYSPRHGTEAAELPDQIAGEVKHERLERLVEVVQRIAAERNAERIGTVEEVLVEGFSRTDATLLRGRTRGNVTVNFTGDAGPGELVDVEIAGATSTTLRGAQRTAVAA